MSEDSTSTLRGAKWPTTHRAQVTFLEERGVTRAAWKRMTKTQQRTWVSKNTGARSLTSENEVPSGLATKSTATRASVDQTPTDDPTQSNGGWGGITAQAHWNYGPTEGNEDAATWSTGEGTEHAPKEEEAGAKD